MVAWPMNSWIAFGLTPASISNDAKVLAALVEREGREKVGVASLPLPFLPLALVDRRPGALGTACDGLGSKGSSGLRPNTKFKPVPSTCASS